MHDAGIKAPIPESKLLKTLSQLRRNDSDDRMESVINNNRLAPKPSASQPEPLAQLKGRSAQNHYAQNVMTELLLKQPLLGGSTSSLTSHASQKCDTAVTLVNNDGAAEAAELKERTLTDGNDGA